MSSSNLEELEQEQFKVAKCKGPNFNQKHCHQQQMEMKKERIMFEKERLLELPNMLAL